jgi:hypothetical protein
VRKENRERVGIVRLLRQMKGRGEVRHKKREMGNLGSHGSRIISRRWIGIRMEN